MAIVGKKYRTQILFEPEQHTDLKKIAQKEDRSVSDIVREIVHAYLAERSNDTVLQQRMDALAAVKRHRAEMLARRNGEPLNIEINEWIDEIREERADELFDSTFSDRD